ncbi:MULTISPECIES: methylamine dehydrogenase accessory protein MauD [Novosphingobium]|uniref:Methylamine utilization protein MauD n=1 Tax=Novosphingobium decolorationis TaxID=2698673 RepID=A0ABX8E804_9SPHN|nr:MULTISPECIES: methylamine dehydrogenase accessory protein MauD [Novosphingobium]MED5544671.1 methylamine dehydrogenase accessory protein MauD [Pseudomonadota bacterium]QVM85321.1 methylamine dehydrogenase accessory protein MauD [Novosphingobium decolorationis]GAM03436.1 methylamine utilization protein mauD [Novosphingobium sp. MBES04]
MLLVTTALVLLWMLVIAMAFVILALARQIGVLHERLAPVGALATAQGAQAGEQAPVMPGHLLGGGTIEIGGALAAGSLRLLLFVAPSCPICKKLIPIALDVARDERVDLVFVGDEDPDEQRRMIERHGLAGQTFVNGPEVGMAFAVAKLPHAILLDDAGKVVARGLVNSREHLESLLVAHETGHSNVQSYLRASRAPALEAAE